MLLRRNHQVCMMCAQVFLLMTCIVTAARSAVDLQTAVVLADERKLAVLSFTEDWCDACPRLNAIVEGIMKDIPQLDYFEVDLENDVHAWQHFKVDALPHIVVTVRGTPVAYSGELQADSITKWLQRIINKNLKSIEGRLK